MTQRKALGILILILLFGFLLRLPYFFHTMQDIDEGSHASNAATLLDGGLPYLDAVNNKPPGIFYIYAATFLIFGKYNMLAIHMVAFLWTLATAAILNMLAKNLLGKSAGMFALLFYLTFTAALYPKMLAANSEIFMALPYSLAVLLLWHACTREKGYLYFVSGFASGLAPLIKQVGGIEAAAVAIYLLILIPLLHGKDRILPSLSACIRWACGFILPILAVALLFHKYGILADQIFWNITYPGRYINHGVSNLSFTSQIVAEFLPFICATIILWILSSLWIRRTLADLADRNKAASTQFSLFLLVWLLTSTLATFVGNRMYGHYFIQILPPLSLLAALFAGKFADEASGLRVRYWKAAILALTVIPGFVFTAMAISYESTTDTWGEIRPDFRPATEYIKTHTDPQDKIFVWGWFTPVYVYSERTPATRFVFTSMHTGYRRGNNPKEKDRADITWVAAPEAWPMLEADLNNNRPELIIDTAPGDYHNFGRYPLKDYPILRSFVARNCRMEKQIAGMDIYRCGGLAASTGSAGGGKSR